MYYFPYNAVKTLSKIGGHWGRHCGGHWGAAGGPSLLTVPAANRSMGIPQAIESSMSKQICLQSQCRHASLDVACCHFHPMSISQQNVLHLFFLLWRQCPRTSACSAKRVLPIGICDTCSNNQNYKVATLKLSKLMVPICTNSRAVGLRSSKGRHATITACSISKVMEN